MQGKCYMYCACLVAYLVSSLVHHQYQYQLSAIQHRYIQVSSFCRSFYHNQCTPCLLHASCSPCLAPPVLSNQILKHQVQCSPVTSQDVSLYACIRAVIQASISPSAQMDFGLFKRDYEDINITCIYTIAWNDHLSRSYLHSKAENALAAGSG